MTHDIDIYVDEDDNGRWTPHKIDHNIEDENCDPAWYMLV